MCPEKSEYRYCIHQRSYTQMIFTDCFNLDRYLQNLHVSQIKLFALHYNMFTYIKKK